MAGENEWPDIDFTGDPRVILGSRHGGRGLDGRRIDVHEEAFADLRAVCEPALAELDAARPRPYEPFAELEKGEEYFRVETGDLPDRAHRRARSGVSPTDGDDGRDADLIRLVQGVDELEAVGDLDDLAYAFYAVCWPVDGGFVGFVKKTDPRRALRAGKRWFQFGDALRRADPPDLVLEPDIDVVVTPGFIAARNATAFKNLLNDVQVALAAVPADVRAVASRLRKSVPLSKGAAAALEAVATKKVSFARRVSLLPDRLAMMSTLDAASLRKELKAVGVPVKTLLNPRGEFDFDADAVGVFLDVLESRYFDDRLGGEQRRADRYSTR